MICLQVAALGNVVAFAIGGFQLGFELCVVAEITVVVGVYAAVAAAAEVAFL